MATDDASAVPAKTIPRKLLSAVYLCLATMPPIAVVLSIVHHHTFNLFVSMVGSALLVPLAIALTRQSGPAMKLIFPVIVTAVIGFLLIGNALG